MEVWGYRNGLVMGIGDGIDLGLTEIYSDSKELRSVNNAALKVSSFGDYKGTS
jgi:hypothetical protein